MAIDESSTTTGWSRPPGFTTGGLGVEPMTSLLPNAADHSITTVNEGATVRSSLNSYAVFQ